MARRDLQSAPECPLILTLVTLPTLPLSLPEMTFTVSPVRIGIGSRTGLPFFVSG